jgi:hypothetical protein
MRRCVSSIKSGRGCPTATNMVCWACDEGICPAHSSIRPWGYGAEGQGSGKVRPHRVCDDCWEAWQNE